MSNIWILAQTEDNGGSEIVGSTRIDDSQLESTGTTAPGGNGDTLPSDPNAGSRNSLPGKYMWVLWAAMLVMMYFMLFRGPKKKQQEHKKMLQSLKKNDRVRTVGGILGTVIDVKDDEVVLKVDESTNTKIRVSASAIGNNLSKDSE
jgi:preprotein translocase subunit YajC